MGNYLENFGSISQPWQFHQDKQGKHTMQMMLPQMEPKKKPRLTSNERKRIEKMLDDGWTPYKIAKTLGRPPKTIMREITNRAIKSLKGSVGRINNRCVANLFDIRRIPANDIVLKPKLLGIEQKVRPWVTTGTDPKARTNKAK